MIVETVKAKRHILHEGKTTYPSRGDTYSLCSYSFRTNQAFGQTKIGSGNKLVIKYVEKLLKSHPEAEVVALTLSLAPSCPCDRMP